MKSIVILLLLVTLANGQSYGFGLGSTNPLASATSSYIFGISLDGSSGTIDIQSGTQVSITFPTDYSNRLTPGSTTCNLLSWGDGSQTPLPTPSCSLTSSTATIDSLFTQAYTITSYFDITIQIDNIKNPIASGNTGNFIAYLPTATGIATITATGIGITAATMTCSATVTPTTVNSNGAINIQFNTPEFQTSSTVQIDFSTFWPQENPQSTQIIPSLGSVSCSPGTNAGSSISCSFTQIGASTFSGTASNVVSTAQQNTPITFSFGTIVTPPTTKAQGSFLIIAKTGGKTMSQCTTSVSGLTPGSITNPSLTPSVSSVNSLSQLSLTFTPNTNLVNTDTITVTFPSQVSVSQITQVSIPAVGLSLSPSISGQAITISGAVVAFGASLTMNFISITNPPSQLPTSTFAITTSRNSFSMGILSSSLTFSGTRTAISSASLSASSLSIGQTSTYTLQFTLAQPLTASSAIVIGLPPDYQSNVGSCSPSPCTVTSTQVTFTSVPTTSGTSFQMTLSGIVNPLTIGTTNSLTLYTIYSSSQTTSYVQYTNTGITIDLVARVIPVANIAIGSNSQVVSYSPATFTIAVTNINPLPANFYAQVYLPPEIGINQAQLSCQAGSAAVSCTYNSATRMITFSSISAVSVAAGGLVSSPLVINNLINPSSTSPTSSFGVYILNTLNQIIEYQAGGLTFTSNQAANFFSLTLIPSNTINSAPTSLSVKFSITSTSYQNSSLLVVTFPSQINIQSTSCTAVSSNLLGVSCSPNSNRVQAILSFNSLSTSQAVQFTIQTYQNYPSLQTYTMQVDLYADFHQNSKLNTNANSPNSFKNTAVGAITIASHSFSNAVLLESTNLNFQISTTDGLSFSYLVVSFPAEFSTTAVSCSLPSGLTCTTFGSSVTINSSSSISLPLIGAINGLISPSFSPSSNIYVQSFNSNNFLMDSNTQIFFTTTCTLPCKTCSSPSLPTVCTSCYSNTSLVSGQVLQNGTSCVSVCGTGLYQDNTTSSCLACVSPCATCQSLSICYTCTSGSFLYNSSCLTDCPFGFYGFNSQCLACSTAIFCQSCPNSYSCSTCLTGYFFYNAQCYQTCPSDISYPNSVNRTCDLCPSNCTNCQGNSSLVTCTVCNTGYVLDSGRCYLDCVTSGLIAVSGICQGCTSPCSTCSVLVTNCTSCLTNGSAPYLYNFNCLTTCPNGFYEDSTTFSCQTCTSPCQLCANVSVHSCLSCLTGYYLYLSDCLVTCPSQFYNVSGQCQPCVSPCLTCTDFSTCNSCTNNTFLYQGQCLSQCPSGMAVVNGNQCLICMSICATCSSTTFCDTCFPNTYLYNGTCIALCPDGTFANTTSLICETCQSPCSNCLNNSYCLTCSDSTKFQVNGACVSCTSPCSSCSLSITNCTSCLSSTSTPYIFNNTCISICPSNYYSDNATYTCSLCVSPCLDCNGPTSSSCVSCVTGYYLLLNLCLTVCPSTYFANINTCDPCQSPCLTCSSASVCLSCVNGTYLLGSSCVSSCGTGSTVLNNSICSFCSSSCQTCLSSNSAACTSCYSGAFLDQTSQTCSSTCTNGFYPDSSSGNGLCVGCIAPCQYCSSATYCQSCIDSTLFLVNGSCLGCSSPCLTCSSLRTNCTSCDTASSSPYLYSGTCNSGCLFGFYADSSFICIACTSPCASCNNGSLTSCLSCIGGYYQLISSCYAVCPSGYFPNATQCSVCVSPCQTCSDGSTCLSCVSGFYLFGSSCVTNCSAGMAIINGTTCQYCSSSCQTCQSSNSSACTSCPATTYLYGNTCSTSCVNTTYPDNTTNVCQPCVNPCSTCSSSSFCLSCLDTNKFLDAGSCVGCTSPCITCSGSPTTCTSCQVSTGFPFLFNSSCLASCPGGYYGQSSTSTCNLCISPCQTCTSASLTSCLSCISNYVLLSGSCLTACPNGYYSDNITCFGCPSPCQNCADNSTCTSCQGSLLLQGSQCVSSCSTGLTVINSLYCSYCNGSCLSCLSSNTSACTSCYPGLFLLGTVCYADCPSGYYEDNTTNNCLSCVSPCATCNSASTCLSCLDPAQFLVSSTCLGCLSPCLTCSTVRTNCTSCDTGSSFPYLVNNNCLTTCPAGMYANGLSCSTCVSPCDSCLNASTSSCQTCVGGYVLMGSTCLSVCPNGYYSDGIQCILCVSPCDTCSSVSVCLSCIAGQYLLGSSCYSTCPGGMISTTVGNNNVCEYCATTCNTCLSANSSYCTSCPNSTYLLIGQCLSNCSSGYYQNTAANTCDLCVSPCSTCTSASFCLSCALSTDFLIGSTCTSCQSPCLTCSTGINTCSSCNTSSSHPYFYLSNCLTTCPSTYYNSASFVCTSCQSPCSTCSGPGNQSCLTCLAGYLQLNSTCYISCPGGYYNHSNICILCTSPCLTCSGPGSTACISCTSGLYLLGSTCVSNCSGLAVNGSTCVYCSSTCNTCQTSDSTYCTSCTGLFLFNGQCLTNCSSGYYQDSATSQCKPCLSPCLTCSSTSACLSCIDSTTFLINSSCVGCSNPCLTCTGTVTNCTSCDSISGFPILFQSSCIGSCPTGYYQDTPTSCSLCTTPCSSCLGPGVHACLTCLTNSFMLNTTCYSVCPTGYYSNVDQCTLCTSPCSSCQITPTTCTSCISGYLLRGSSCVTNCSTGQVVVNNTYCQVCTSNCLTCLSSNFSYCTSCSTGTFLSVSACLINCPNLTYADSTTKQCLACVSPCVSCSSLTACTSCLSSLFLVGTACQSCFSPCLTCSLSQSNCTACNTSSSNPYLLLNGCLSSCPIGYYDGGSFNCLACVSPCATCTAGTNRSCLTCDPGYYQLGSDCYSVCPDGYYTNGTDCIFCNTSLCLTCTISATTCLSCISGLYLHGSSCVASCPSSMVVFNNSICLSCTSNCFTCLSSNSSYCTSCYTNNYLFNGTCSTSCIDTYFADPSGSCLKCVSPCALCQSLTACLSCVDPLTYLQNFTCVSSCTYPLIAVNGTCYQCSSQCATCIQTVSTCLLCATNFYYFNSTFACELTCSFFVLPSNISNSGNNECTQTCPSGTYPDVSTSSCVQCPAQCSLCGNSSYCTQCATGYSFYLNFCYSPCPAAAPYSVNSICLLCNITFCQTCLNTTYCDTCDAFYLLIADGNSSTCIANCTSGYYYDSALLACIIIPEPPASTNIVQSSVPPYTFLISAAALTFLIFIIRFKYPTTELALIMFLMLNLVSSAVMINLLVIEIEASGMAQGNFSNVSVSTALLLAAGGIQLSSSIGSLIAIANIKDPELALIWQQSPISFIAIILLCLIDSNFIFITCCHMLDISVFQANLGSNSMLKVLKFGLFSSLLVKILQLVYSCFQLTFYRSNAYRLLAATSYPIQNSATIELIVLTLVCLGFIVYLLCSHFKSDKEESIKQEESHQSLMDQKNAFDKRNQSNAQIMMSVDNSDMIVDINSLKDQRQISDVENSNMYFQDPDSTSSRKKFRKKKVSPDQMLREMDHRIQEKLQDEEQDREGPRDEQEFDMTKTEAVIFQNSEERDNNNQLSRQNRFSKESQERGQNMERRDESRNINDISDRKQQFKKSNDNNQGDRGEVVLLEQNSVELFDTSNSKLADISQIIYKQNGQVAQRSNIFDSSLQQDEKTKTVLDFDKSDNNKIKQENANKYSPSQISKYRPNPNINNQFAQSYLDDANKFNEHQFRKKIPEGNEIKFEEVNQNFKEEEEEEEEYSVSFRKKGNFIEPEVHIVKQPESREEQKKRQEQQIAKILQGDDKYKVDQIQEEDSYRQTPMEKHVDTPIQNTFVQDLEEPEDFKPSQGLQGRRRVGGRRKPDIPLPKNVAEKKIMNIYGKKVPATTKQSRRRYDPHPNPTKQSSYVDYSLEDNQFLQQKNEPKPIFSGQIPKNIESRYKRSVGSNDGSGEEDMPIQPSKRMRKSSFKKIGEMIMDSQNSARK